MKKIIILAIIVALLFSLITAVSADNEFIVKHSTINERDEYCNINIASPYFEGFKSSEELNHLIRNIVIDNIGQVRATGIELKEFNKKTELIIFYDYTKYDNLLSVQLSTYNYLGGAHGSSQIIPMNININTGNIYNFKDLFDDKSISFVENRILDMISKNPEMYFEDYEHTIKDKNGEFNFYFDGNKLVIYFGQYDITPYAAGIRYFELNISDLKGIIKDDIYNSVIEENAKGHIYYNGLDIKSKNELIQNNDCITMVPLRDIAESLGYKVDWNKEDGAIIAGGFIKAGINSYWKAGTEPVQLIAPIVKNGVTYVPSDYFTKVLEENIIISNKNNENLAVKIFEKYGFENNFDKLIKDFYYPGSGDEAVKMYAQAAKNRNGAFQYALLSNKLKKEKYEELKGFSFVTGASSPWIDSYEIVETGENLYKVEFTLITSVPGEILTHSINIKTIEENDYWKIATIE